MLYVWSCSNLPTAFVHEEYVVDVSVPVDDFVCVFVVFCV